jgi:hypothetical protein
MGFSELEKKVIAEQVDENVAMKQYLDDGTYNFLTSQGYLKLIDDRIVYTSSRVPSNRHPYYGRKIETVRINKFLTEKVDLPKFIKDITRPLTGFYEISIDVASLVLTKDNDLKYMFPSRTNRINKRHKISTKNDWKEFISEIESYTPYDFLIRSFENHVIASEMQESGFRPGRLLSCTLYITKIN